jgi:hypothetical protein
MMLSRTRGIFFSPVSRAAWLASILLFLSSVISQATPSRSNVVCREDISPAHREQLAAKLRRITGLSELRFDEDGVLRQSYERVGGGSSSARELIANSINGNNVVVIEDASNSAAVAFCRVIPGKWKNSTSNSPPAFVVQIDFADFDQLVGDAHALEAFNVGWGFLHELDHIANDSPDAVLLSETGECEAHVNQMRRECNLPQRRNYFSTLLPGTADSTFPTHFVRIAFEQAEPDANKKKRYWIVWDASVVGGLEQNQIAALR